MDTSKTEEPSPIENLDDDCLVQIFNHLSFDDRVRIELVCTRFATVSRKNWCLYSKSLEFGTHTGNFPISNKYRTMDSKGIADIVRNILRYRGAHLEEITFSPICRDILRIGTLSQILKSCPRLKYIDVENLVISNDDFLSLTRYCNILRSFTLNGNLYSCCEWLLELLFKQNKGLRHLRMMNCKGLTIKCLEKLNPGVLETLDIRNCYYFKFTNASVARLVPSLTHLTLMAGLHCNYGFGRIAEFTKLRELILDISPLMMYQYANHTMFKNIANNCRQLERVELGTWCPIRSANEIEPILNLPELRILKMFGCVEIREELFEGKPLDKLEELRLQCCSMAGIAYRRLVNRLTTLKAIEICDCSLDNRNEWRKIEQTRYDFVCKVKVCDPLVFQKLLRAADMFWAVLPPPIRENRSVSLRHSADCFIRDEYI